MDQQKMCNTRMAKNAIHVLHEKNPIFLLLEKRL